MLLQVFDGINRVSELESTHLLLLENGRADHKLPRRSLKGNHLLIAKAGRLRKSGVGLNVLAFVTL
jgi:hypothetical protein